MKNINQLKFPDNLAEIIEEDGIWEDDSFEPFLITAVEAEFKGHDVISYQVEFSPELDLEEQNEILRKYNFETDGYAWEGLIREYVEIKEPAFQKMIIGDSESDTCVLWTANQYDFRKLLNYVQEVISKTEEVIKFIKENTQV